MGEEPVGAPVAYYNTFVIIELETNTLTKETDGVNVFLKSRSLLLPRNRHEDLDVIRK
jgi:hypothetical protein